VGGGRSGRFLPRAASYRSAIATDVQLNAPLWDPPKRSPPQAAAPPDVDYDPDFFARLTQ